MVFPKLKFLAGDRSATARMSLCERWPLKPPLQAVADAGTSVKGCCRNSKSMCVSPLLTTRSAPKNSSLTELVWWATAFRLPMSSLGCRLVGVYRNPLNGRLFFEAPVVSAVGSPELVVMPAATAGHCTSVSLLLLLKMGSATNTLAAISGSAAAVGVSVGAVGVEVVALPQSKSPLVPTA